jgi:hypothetical protein
MKKVRVYNHLWNYKEYVKARNELDRWNKAFTKRMEDIRYAKGKGVKQIKKAYTKKLPKISKKALELSRQAHEAI